MSLAFEMKNITKVYPGVVANDNVSISAVKGSVLCIIGENGAGKSTLMNMLYGMEKPTSGEIFLSDKKVDFVSSRDAIKHNIGMVFQHFMLIHELTCLENIIIGMEPQKGIVIDIQKAKQDITQIMDQYNMQIPLDKKAGSLWVGVQQKLEILKTLYRGAEIIILDEPTAVLTPQETQELFVNIKRLASMGKTIILITHKLDEVMQVADEIVVMRAGKYITKLKPSETDIHGLSVHMVGSEIPPMKERLAVSKKKVLELNNITVFEKNGTSSLKNFNITLNKGEILGIAGISGNGQGQLAQMIAGLIKPDSGNIIFNEENITLHERKKRIEDGISYIPEDRNSTGICSNWTIENNIFSGYQKRFVKKFDMIDREKTSSFANEMIKKFAIKTPSADTVIKSLSGGNCQKVIVARETAFSPEIVIASEPSRGVDIGAISTIHNHMIELRNMGTAVLLISSSLDEIFALSDRIGVIFEGEITAILDPREATREEVGLYMSGAKKEGVILEE